MYLPTTLLSLLQSAQEPLTVVQLVRRLPSKAPAKTVAATLADLADKGSVLTFTQGKTSAYAAWAPVDMCAEALARQLPLTTGPVAATKLKTTLPKSLRPWFDEALGHLIVQGKAFWLPKGKSRLVLSRPVRPSDVLSTAALGQLKKVLFAANRYRTVPRSLDELLGWLDGEATAAVPSPAVITAAKPTPELLHQWYQADRAKTSSAMIPIPHTWKHYESWAATHGMPADIVDFRQALEALYNSGNAVLEPCERPQDLPEDERRLQVPLSIGPPGYYWSPMV
jgi:hypothetical protein